MKKISFIIVFSLLSFIGFGQEKGAYLNLSGGIGFTGFNYDLRGLNSDGTNKYLLGGNGALGFSYYFTPNWGIGTGVGVSYYRSKGKYDESLDKNSYYTLGTLQDDDNRDREYDLRVRLANWEEKQTGYFLEIPLMLMYQHRFGNKKRHGLYFGIGGKIQIPIQGKFEVIDSDYENDYRLNVSGAYKDGVPEMGAPGDPALDQHGYGSIHNPNERYGWNDDLELKPSFAGVAEFGFLFGLNRRWDLTVGGYLDYGFNNIKKGDEKPLMEIPEQYHPSANDNVAAGIRYNGMINSDVTDRVNLVSVGVKVGIRVKLGKLEEKPEEDVPIEIPVCDTIHDTIVIEKVEKIIEKQIIEKEPEFTEQEEELFKARIFFDLDCAKLRPEAKNTLNEVVAFMNKHPEMDLRILGNTCDLGNENINIPLGLRRAESAKKYLIEQGISSHRLSTATVSSHDPLLPNIDEMNRKLNRRCEFQFEK